ncbi:MAG: hypothetical protein JW778_01455 [Candidatus Altiarchaeota archaeon]|nr:hypothetical protein [Candidatus Altiarchaeota archaeon]
MRKRGAYIGLIILLILFMGCLTWSESDMIDEVIGAVEEKTCDNFDPSTVDPSFDRDHCFKDAALRKGDPNLCAKIKSSPPKTKCYMEVAEKIGRGDLCNYLPINPGSSGEYSQIECLQKVAVKTLNGQLCEQMYEYSYSPFFGPTYNRENCLKAIEEEKKNRMPAVPEPREPGDLATTGVVM